MKKEPCQRILILGSPGSGKTTLSGSIAKKINCPLYHLDDLYWTGNWERSERSQFETRVEKIIQGDNWIIEGNYYHLCFKQRLNRANTVILLNIPVVICLYRVLKRYFRISLGHVSELPKNVQEYGHKNHVKSNINLQFLWVVLRFRAKVFNRMKDEILNSNCDVLEVHWHDVKHSNII